MQNRKTKQNVNFFYNETLYGIHPDEAVEVSYIGEAEITTEQLPASDGGGSVVVVDFTRLWMGVDVASNWKNSDYRAVKVPNSDQKFYNLLETAALDAAESTTVVRLPN